MSVISPSQEPLNRNNDLFIGTVALPSPSNRNSLIETIESLIYKIIIDLMSNTKPYIKVRSQREWSNCNFEDMLQMKEEQFAVLAEISFHPEKDNVKFAQTMLLLHKTYQHLITDSVSSRREVYYENLEMFRSQSETDRAGDEISCLLGVPQWDLGLLAAPKGCVIGNLAITLQSTTIDCSVQGGVLIPSDLSSGVKLESDAKFVLVVEKDSVFQKICEEDFMETQGPCIMVTGKGYPDVSTRALIKLIHEQLSLPIYILVDSDPHGIEIMCIYKFGSLKQSHISDKLAVPSARWLGVHPTDIEHFNVQCKDLTVIDRKKAECLLNRPYSRNDLKLSKQLEFLLSYGKKSEVEAIIQISNCYLSNMYIPLKISSKQCI